MSINCVNCWAPVSKTVCPYCGTQFHEEAASVDLLNQIARAQMQAPLAHMTPIHSPDMLRLMDAAKLSKYHGPIPVKSGWKDSIISGLGSVGYALIGCPK